MLKSRLCKRPSLNPNKSPSKFFQSLIHLSIHLFYLILISRSDRIIFSVSFRFKFTRRTFPNFETSDYLNSNDAGHGREIRQGPQVIEVPRVLVQVSGCEFSVRLLYHLSSSLSSQVSTTLDRYPRHNFCQLP